MSFEPKGEVLIARDGVRAALLSMPASTTLTAEYSSDGLGLCDVENVLHYNVGPSWLQHLCSRRLVFERLFTAPPTAPSTAAYHHHVRYRAGDHPRLAWSVGELVGQRRFVIPRGTPLDLAHVWLHARRAAASAPASASASPERLALSLTVRTAFGDAPHLGSVLKGLVDGFVCSMHRHDSDDLDELASRLASRFGKATEAREIGELLMVGAAELGGRRLLYRRDTGVQWNPADDGLVVIEAEIQDANIVDTEVHAQLRVALPIAAAETRAR